MNVVFMSTNAIHVHRVHNIVISQTENTTAPSQISRTVETLQEEGEPTVYIDRYCTNADVK